MCEAIQNFGLLFQSIMSAIKFQGLDFDNGNVLSIDTEFYSVNQLTQNESWKFLFIGLANNRSAFINKYKLKENINIIGVYESGGGVDKNRKKKKISKITYSKSKLTNINYIICSKRK